MVLVQKWPFFQLFWGGQYRTGTCLLPYFETKKMPFQAIKTRSSKSRKIDIFLTWLTHGFGQKMTIFPTFFLGQYRPGTFLLRYSRTRKMPFQAIKTRSSKKIDIFVTGLTHGFGPKMAIFPTFLFRQNRPEKCFLRY